jgi:hypothetical protein
MRDCMPQMPKSSVDTGFNACTSKHKSPGLTSGYRPCQHCFRLFEHTSGRRNTHRVVDVLEDKARSLGFWIPDNI